MAYNIGPGGHIFHQNFIGVQPQMFIPNVGAPFPPFSAPNFPQPMVNPVIAAPMNLPPLEKLPIPSIHRALNPTTTIFVGNIHDNAPDLLMRNILGKIGNVISWKRVQGINGKLQAFGFCEFDDPEATLRAIRLLHNFDIGGKKLLVKVDAKSKDKLKEYKINKKRETSFGANENQDFGGQNGNLTSYGTKFANDNEEETDEDIFKLDVNALKRDNNILVEIKRMVKEHAYEFQKSAEDELAITKEKLSRTQRLGQPLDEEKTEVISKEILRFKENNLKDEKYREKIREKEREKRERERLHSSRKGSSPRALDNQDRHHKSSSKRRRSRSISQSSRRSSRRHKSPDRRRSRSKSINLVDPTKVAHVVRDESLERRDREARRAKEEREQQKRLEQEAKEEEEREKAYERRRLERKLRDKEASYQEQLKAWEAREAKKLREHKKRKEYEEFCKEEEITEARKLREFLEDYVDDRDDQKYYKGQFLARRLKEREKEMEIDLKDRQKEKEEIEEIKARLALEGHPDLDEEIAKLEQNRSKHLKPQLKISSPPLLIENTPEVNSTFKEGRGESPPIPPESLSKKRRISYKRSPQLGNILPSSPVNGDQVAPPLPTTDALDNVIPPPIQEAIQAPYADSLNIKPALGFKSLQLEKRKANTDSLFIADDEEDLTSKPKLSALGGGNTTQGESKKPTTQVSLEEKRQSIKRLIEKIPTNKAKLFAYVIEWEWVDNLLMEKRIKPWINKKIIEYIGEEEPTLVEFICSKLLNHNEPQSILDDILMVLDEEAEVFIVKLWRLLIYEIEAKRTGLLKPTD